MTKIAGISGLRSARRLQAQVAAAALAVAGVGLGALAAPAAGATGGTAVKYTLTIVTIGRDGAPATGGVINVLSERTDRDVMTSRHGTLPAGQYLIGAQVNSPGPTPGVMLSTVFVRALDLSRNTTVTLDARTGRPLRVSLNLPGARQLLDGVQVTSDQLPGQLAGAVDQPAGTIFIAPSSVRQLCFGYLSQWQDAAGRPYDLAGSVTGELPAQPSFHVLASSLARLHLTIRAGVLQAANQLEINPTGCNVGDFTTISGPSRSVRFFTPGRWQTTLWGVRGIEADEQHFLAGRTYSLLLGGAVMSPAWNYPGAIGATVIFDAASLFSFPLATIFSSQCCARSVIKLTRGSLLIKLSHVTDAETFSAHLSRAGWYTLAVRSVQSNSPGQVPAGQLSPTVAVTWRFYDGLTKVENLPVTLGVYVPGGLDLNNAAAPHALTPLKILVFRPDPNSGPGPGPVYSIRAVRLQVSSDDGKTWTTVPVTKHNGAWIAQVPDPASGYVSLRTTVTDLAGDSTTETIYRAYAIR